MPDHKTLKFTICSAAIALLLGACSESAPPAVESVAAVPAPAVSSAPPEGQLGDALAPVQYKLELRIDPRLDSFSGVVAIDVLINEATDTIWLHGKGLEVSEVYLTQGEAQRIEASYQQRLDSGVSEITLEQAIEAGPATLHLTYSAPFNTSAFALFKVKRGDDAYAVTQFEPIAARQAFPGFDEPGFKVPFDLSVVSHADDVTITSTPEVSTEVLDDGYVRHVFARTRPLPTYLLAFAVGPYDLVNFGNIPPNSIRDREVELRGVAARGQGQRMEYALKNTAAILTVLEEYFGTPYPYRKLDLIAVPESFGGAMENPGAITYDEYLMLLDEESSISQRRAYTVTHAHELAHMWFGDLVTPKWWNDIWLNESFATWMMNKVSDRYWQEGEFDRETLKGALSAMTNDSLASARQIREPVEKNEQITDAFDGITYQKGGGVLGMLERYMGEEEMQAGIRLHMERHADGTATAEDFIKSLAEGSGRSEIESAFRSYIEQPGVPLISTQVNCDDEQNPQLEVSQGRYAPMGSTIDPGSSQWQVPLCVTYLAGGSKKSTCAMLKESKQSIPLDSDSCPTQVHPNADGAGYYRFSMDETWWNGLIADTQSLAPAEALVLGDSLDASFRAGLVPAETYARGMVALLNHDTWDVADSAMSQLEQITNILDVEQMEALQQALLPVVQRRFSRLSESSGTGSDLLHQRMQRFLIVILNDTDMRKPLAKQAAARIGLHGEPDPSAVPESELETVLSIGVQDIGEPFFDLLVKQALASEDPAFRNSAFGSLARAEDPMLVNKLHKLMLTGDFKGTEFTSMLFRQMVRKASSEATYLWVRENDVKVIEMIPEFFRSGTVPALGGAFCTAQRADEWQEFIHSHAAMLPGYERSLAQTIETINLCAALKQARAVEMVTAFQSAD